MRRARWCYAVLFFILFFLSCGGSSAETGKDKCVMLPCHGLEFQCVLKSSDMVCTEMYVSGDNCRKFAQCQRQNDNCSLVTTPEFDLCKACVQKCNSDYENDPVAAFDCDSKCVDK